MKPTLLTLVLSLSLPLVLCAAETPLTDLDDSAAVQGWQRPQVDTGVAGYPLGIGGVAYETGIGIHAPFSWKLPLAGKATQFKALVGVQDAPGRTDKPGSVEFIVRGDGKELFRSGLMRGGMAAKKVEVPLAGVKELELVTTDGDDGNTSDHGDWIDAVIVHDGAPLPIRAAAIEEPLIPDQPGEPPNAGAQVDWNEATGLLSLTYEDKLIFSCHVQGAKLKTTTGRKRQALTQTLTLTGKNLRLQAIVVAREEAMAAETRGEAQKQFPLVRTSIGGPSRNLRNNGVYDRGRDWMLAGVTGAVSIEPRSEHEFTFEAKGDTIELTFKPRFYQRHKGISFFQPWNYQVRKDSITGWSSWWAFMRNCSQKDCESLLAVWKEKRLNEFGYRFIQLDDCFQNEFGPGGNRPSWPGSDRGYRARGPETWLDWRKDTYPGGINGYVAACKGAGFEPALWIGNYFTDKEVIEKHPDWFIAGKDGKPFVAPWASVGIDATNQQAMDTLVRPTYQGVKKAGFSYVKIDLMRHYLYDNLHHNLDYCKGRKVTPAEMFRKYLGTARQELGRDTFILSCWGVLPESVGIADACRIGGDGYGPATMQQYNSWNGIVWRNDPDHCDVYPKFKPAEAGNVTKTDKVVPTNNDTVIRPALASISGCMLLLSDKPDVYRDDRNLEGAKRAAPVLFSVPGQLYDFDERHSSTVPKTRRESITSGGNPVSCDADQFGAVCPWWLNEINLPNVGSWNVLHRVNWGGKAPAATISFADLGLKANADYLVYEFWTGQFLGIKRGKLELPEAQPMELRSYSLRQLEDHPQIVSTSRHLSQGAVDLVSVDWDGHRLSGKSQVITGDRYELAIHFPAGYQLKSAKINGQPAKTVQDGELLRASFVPAASGNIEWTMEFSVPANAWRQKITFSIEGLDADGLSGPADGKVSVDYEFCIPETDAAQAEVKAIDPSVKFSKARGRIGRKDGEWLCTGNTHQKDCRAILERLAKLTYVRRINQCFWE
jgi:hypothetical protein